MLLLPKFDFTSLSSRYLHTAPGLISRYNFVQKISFLVMALQNSKAALIRRVLRLSVSIFGTHREQTFLYPSFTLKTSYRTDFKISGNSTDSSEIVNLRLSWTTFPSLQISFLDHTHHWCQFVLSTLFSYTNCRHKRYYSDIETCFTLIGLKCKNWVRKQYYYSVFVSSLNTLNFCNVCT